MVNVRNYAEVPDFRLVHLLRQYNRGEEFLILYTKWPKSKTSDPVKDRFDFIEPKEGRDKQMSTERNPGNPRKLEKEGYALVSRHQRPDLHRHKASYQAKTCYRNNPEHFTPKVLVKELPITRKHYYA